MFRPTDNSQYYPAQQFYYSEQQYVQQRSDLAQQYAQTGYPEQQFYPEQKYITEYQYQPPLDEQPLSSVDEKEMEETALSIQEIVKPEDLFDPLFQQGRVEPKERTWASLLDPYKLTKDSFKSEEELRQAQRFSHENGIFGAYCLEDVRSISHLVLSKYPQSCLSYDCFNYETVKEITLDKQVIRSNTAPADHINMYYQNSILLRQLMKEGKLNFTVHYHDKRNDLLQKIKAKLRLETDWLNSIAYIPKT